MYLPEKKKSPLIASHLDWSPTYIVVANFLARPRSLPPTSWSSRGDMQTREHSPKDEASKKRQKRGRHSAKDDGFGSYSDSYDSSDDRKPTRAVIRDMVVLQTGTLTERCSAILARLHALAGSQWFDSPVDAKDPSTQRDYGTVAQQLNAGEFTTLAEFAAAARQVLIDAVSTHFSPTDERHIAALGALQALEKALAVAAITKHIERERVAPQLHVARQDRSEDEPLRVLRVNLEAAGASLSILKGWSIKIDVRQEGVTAGTTDLYFISR